MSILGLLPSFTFLTRPNTSECPFRSRGTLNEQRVPRPPKNKKVATSQTTSYNAKGNGQAERFDGVVCKVIAISLSHSIRSRSYVQLPIKHHTSASSSSASIPATWLAAPASVYIKHQICSKKTEPWVDKVELLQANPYYTHMWYPDSGETTVATKHLALNGQAQKVQPLSPSGRAGSRSSEERAP